MGYVLLEFVDSLFEPVKVELVFDEILVNLAEEAVIFEAAEPLNPADVYIFAKLRLLAHQILILDSKFKYTSEGLIIFNFLIHFISDRHSPRLLVESLVLNRRVNIPCLLFLFFFPCFVVFLFFFAFDGGLFFFGFSLRLFYFFLLK